MRRRVLAGTLPHKREATPQGYRYWVLVDPVADESSSAAPAPPPATETAALLAQVQSERDWLRQHAEEQAQTIARLTRQAEAYQVLLGQAQAALRQLAPPVDDGQLASHQVDTASRVASQPAPGEGTGHERQPVPRPWWARWLWWRR